MEKSKSINVKIDYNFNKIKKNIVNYTIIIFGFVFILIFLLLTLYYLTPNNYKITNWDESKFKFEEQIEFAIKPESIKKINISKGISKYLRFREKTNLIVKNFFKSQSVYVSDDNDLIISKYNSEIFIVNNSNSEKHFIIKYYSLN